MGILVIITTTISESFRIIIRHRSNFISEFLIFLSICILLFVLHFFNIYFLFIFILLQFLLMNWTFIDILLSKSRMQKNINEKE
jgi:hypothetical protein